MVLLTLSYALAQQFSAPQAKTSLVSEVSVVQPGQPFKVALKMDMAPEWHSYYANPGESGQPTGIKWHLPPGFTAGPILWPAPTRIVIGGVAGYVYENSVYLSSVVTPPKTLQPGRTVTIQADVNWLLCREACVPQKSKLTLNLSAGTTPTPNPAFAPAIPAIPTQTQKLPLKAAIKNGSAVLTLAQPVAQTKDVQFFPADPAYFGADLSTIKTTQTGMILTVPLSKYASGTPKRITGILVIPNGQANGAHWIDVQVGKL